MPEFPLTFARTNVSHVLKSIPILDSTATSKVCEQLRECLMGMELNNYHPFHQRLAIMPMRDRATYLLLIKEFSTKEPGFKDIYQCIIDKYTRGMSWRARDRFHIDDTKALEFDYEWKKTSVKHFPWYKDQAKRVELGYAQLLEVREEEAQIQKEKDRRLQERIDEELRISEIECASAYAELAFGVGEDEVPTEMVEDISGVHLRKFWKPLPQQIPIEFTFDGRLRTLEGPIGENVLKKRRHTLPVVNPVTTIDEEKESPLLRMAPGPRVGVAVLSGCSFSCDIGLAFVVLTESAGLVRTLKKQGWLTFSADKAWTTVRFNPVINPISVVNYFLLVEIWKRRQRALSCTLNASETHAP